MRVNRDGDNTGGCGMPAVSGNVELIGVSVEVVGNSVEDGSILEGGGSLAGIVLVIARGVSFTVISLSLLSVPFQWIRPPERFLLPLRLRLSVLIFPHPIVEGSSVSLQVPSCTV